MEFVKTNLFFELLEKNGIRKNSEPYKNLHEFLCMDYETYKRGLLVKKMEKVMKDFTKSEYLKSYGVQKKQYQIP